jgi:peptide/nickel transport system substrate-binding protein
MKILRNKKLSAVLALGMIALLIIAACGESAAPTPATEVPPPEEEATTTATAAPEPEAMEPEAIEPTSGGKLVIGKAYEVIENDAHTCSWQLCWELFANVYESLVFLDDDLQAIPGLAESWTTPDDTTYVFKLREGVKFHNGREMVADDVAFSINRLVDPEIGAWWGTSIMWPVKDAVATGPYEVTITLIQPFAPFLSAIAGINAAIIPGAEVRDGTLDLAQDLVGTGPFQVEEHQEGHRWILTRFDDYWQEGLPLLDEIEWRIMPDDSSRVAALRTGEIQLTFFENPAMLDVVADDDNIETINQETVNYYQLEANGALPELSDIRVRQAISLGIDREAMVQLALFGHGSTSGPVPGGFTQWATPLSDLPYYQRDVERAKQLLAEAGYQDGLTLRVWVTDGIPMTVSLGEVMKQQLAEIGVEVELNNLEASVWGNEIWTEGIHELMISWVAGYGDPQQILGDITTSPHVVGVDTTEFQGIFARGYEETDPALRKEIIRELEEHLATEAFFLPLVTRNNYVAYRTDLVQNVELTNIEGYGIPLWQSIRQIAATQ